MTTLLATWEEPGKVAIEAAWSKFAETHHLIDALESGLSAAELDPTLLAIGLGSLPNADGDLELDASIMEGADLSCGAVCAVRGIAPVISVARMVKERTPHVMLAGDQARRFAIEQGMKARNLMTAESIRLYEEWRLANRVGDTMYRHSVKDTHDTVTTLGLVDGKCAAASSTSGWSYKLPGRVGDSPIVGAGIYADDEAGCAGATGLGEELWKAAASFRAVEGMRSGMTAQEACEAVVRQMIRRQPLALSWPCAVLALRQDGDFGAAVTIGQFELWSCVDGVFSMKRYQGLASETCPGS